MARRIYNSCMLQGVWCMLQAVRCMVHACTLYVALCALHVAACHVVSCISMVQAAWRMCMAYGACCMNIAACYGRLQRAWGRLYCIGRVIGLLQPGHVACCMVLQQCHDAPSRGASWPWRASPCTPASTAHRTGSSESTTTAECYERHEQCH